MGENRGGGIEGIRMLERGYLRAYGTLLWAINKQGQETMRAYIQAFETNSLQTSRHKVLNQYKPVLGQLVLQSKEMKSIYQNNILTLTNIAAF